MSEAQDLKEDGLAIKGGENVKVSDEEKWWWESSLYRYRPASLFNYNEQRNS
jgi:hypothetical protein